MWLILVSDFTAFAFLSPIYWKLLQGKLSNARAFLTTWVTAAFYIAYVYSLPRLSMILLLATFNAVAYWLIALGRYNSIKNGLFFALLAVLVLTYYLVSSHLILDLNA
jgi:hypothetical protein